MKDLIEYIAKSLVNSPDDVVVTEEEGEEGITFKLQVADEDKGRIIGIDGSGLVLCREGWVIEFTFQCGNLAL